MSELVTQVLLWLVCISVGLVLGVAITTRYLRRFSTS